MHTTRTDEPTLRLAAVRATVPMSDLVGFFDTAYTRVAQAAAREGWPVVGAAVALYRGMPTDTVDLTAGFAVDAEVGASSDGVEVVELTGGPALTLTYTGAYEGLPEAWALVEEDRAELGVAGRGDFWEEYVTEPSPGGDPQQNVTRLVLPLRADG